MSKAAPISKSGVFDVAVVGAGPAGMMAAVAAAQSGKSVVIIERLHRPGVKLLATGGGHCNLTNVAPRDKFMAAFGRLGRFMSPALEAMDADGLRAFFASLNVQTVSPDGFHVFPATQEAKSVQDAIYRRCQALNVRFCLNTAATRLIVADKLVAGVATSQGTIAAGCVILAAGGKSYPQLGSDGSGLELARHAGHTIVATVPALSPLVTGEDWPGRLAGISAPVHVWVDSPGHAKTGVAGDVLFTHRGLSGPAILDISGQVAGLLAKGPVTIRLDFVQGTSRQQWQQRFDSWRQEFGRRRFHTLLAAYMPARLATAFCATADVGEEDKAAHIPAAAAQKLAAMLPGWPLTVTATEGFNAAMVTRGGVSLKEVDPRTLESKLVGGLYFAGEILDLDGPCGGYNLQWAFSSGNLAGMSAAQAKID